MSTEPWEQPDVSPCTYISDKGGLKNPKILRMSYVYRPFSNSSPRNFSGPPFSSFSNLKARKRLQGDYYRVGLPRFLKILKKQNTSPKRRINYILIKRINYWARIDSFAKKLLSENRFSILGSQILWGPWRLRKFSLRLVKMGRRQTRYTLEKTFYG